jgi:hypothetical protein
MSAMEKQLIDVRCYTGEHSDGSFWYRAIEVTLRIVIPISEV